MQGELKAQIRRVQTGCLMCKKRKKKCDEQKPSCGDCERLHLDCSWPAKRGRTNSNKQRVESTSLPETTPWQMEGVDEAGILTDFDLPPLSCSFLGLGVIDGNTHALDANTPQRFTMDDSMLDFNLSASAGTWDVSHSSIASATVDSDIDSSIISAASPNSTPLSTCGPSFLPDLTSPDDKALYNHYSTVVAKTLCRTSDSRPGNPYIAHLLPMAMSNGTIRHCILALSASHWKRMQPRLSERGLYHQNKATKELANMLSTVAKDSANVALAACLLLCMTEILDGESTGWKHHLQGAKRLLNTMLATDQTQYGAEYGFLVGLARFLDSATTTSTCAPPLIQEDDGDAATFRKMSALPVDSDMAVYGIPKSLFHLVDHVNSLAQKRKTRVDIQSEKEFRQETATVEDLLDHWSFEYGGLSQAVASLSSSPQSNHDILQATTAYEWALRLRFHQIKDGYSLAGPFVSKAVDKILMAVQDVRYGSPLESCLLFPLVMAGGACEGLEHRSIVQNRLMVMERTCGFGYMYRARELVEKVWEHRDALEGTGAIVNWARMRFERMHGLVIF